MSNPMDPMVAAFLCELSNDDPPTADAFFLAPAAATYPVDGGIFRDSGTKSSESDNNSFGNTMDEAEMHRGKVEEVKRTQMIMHQNHGQNSLPHIQKFFAFRIKMMPCTTMAMIQTETYRTLTQLPLRKIQTSSLKSQALNGIQIILHI